MNETEPDSPWGGPKGVHGGLEGGGGCLKPQAVSAECSADRGGKERLQRGKAERRCGRTSSDSRARGSG